MSVLESMRSSSDSTFMQVVLVLIVVSFVGWYAVPQGDKTTVVATVNSVRIMDTEFRPVYANAIWERERQKDAGLTPEEEKSLHESVRQELIEREVVFQEAAKLGVQVSQYEIDLVIMEAGRPRDFTDDEGNIRTTGGYLNEAGGVDEELYENYLNRRGLNKGEHQKRLRRQLLYNKMQEMIFVGTTISEPVLRGLYEQAQRKVDLTYVRIRPSAFYSSIEVSDDERNSWMAENEEKANETYTKDFERLYKHPETLKLSMIRIQIRDGDTETLLTPKINKIREQLVEGTDFATMARRWSEDRTAESGGDMGTRPVLKLASTVTEAVKDLPVGEISRVVSSDTDLRLYRVEERIEPFEESWEEVKDKIATRMIREEKGPTLAVKFAEDELLTAWSAAGEPPTELLQGKGLASQSTGLIPARFSGSPFGPPADLLSAAADVPEGTVLPQVFESNGMYWIAQVTQRVEANLAEFEANRERIRSQVLMQRREQVFTSWRMDAVANATVE